MTTNPLDAIQARADAATEGPWACEPLDSIVYPSTPWSVFSHETNDDGDYPSVTDDSGDLVLTKADAVFIAHAREDVPKLIAALRAVEAMHRNEARNKWGAPSTTHDGHGGWCYHCGRYTGDGCPTITAIREALGG